MEYHQPPTLESQIDIHTYSILDVKLSPLFKIFPFLPSNPLQTNKSFIYFNRGHIRQWMRECTFAAQCDYLKEAPFYFPKKGNNVRSTAYILVVPRVSNATVIGTNVKMYIKWPNRFRDVKIWFVHVASLVKTITGFALHQPKAVSSLSLYSYTLMWIQSLCLL